MSRKRIVITEISISKAGQIKYFQIKLPENAVRIVGVATDIRISSVGFNTETSTGVALYPKLTELAVKSYDLVSKSDTNYQVWNKTANPLAGKLKLQSLEKANIFYYEQVWAVTFNDGIGNVTDDLYDIDIFSVQQKREPRIVDVPAETTLINGMYKDNMGATVKRDIAYTIKVLIWVETNEKEITISK